MTTAVSEPSVSELCRAAEAGDLDAMDEILADAPQLATQDTAANDEHQALHFAVYGNQPHAVRRLLEAGADPDAGGGMLAPLNMIVNGGPGASRSASQRAVELAITKMLLAAGDWTMHAKVSGRGLLSTTWSTTPMGCWVACSSTFTLWAWSSPKAPFHFSAASLEETSIHESVPCGAGPEPLSPCG